jgi:hypothetical protein
MDPAEPRADEQMAPAPPAAPPDAAPAAPPDTPPAAPPNVDTLDLREIEAFRAPRPSAARRLVVGPFWAGALGAGVCLWVASAYASLADAHLVARPSEGPLLLASVGLGLVVALVFGYREPVRSYAALLGRTIGALVFGLFELLLLGVLLVAIFESNHVTSRTGFAVFCAVGLLLAAIALARTHQLTQPGPRQTRAAVLGAALALLTAWSVSPSFRCLLGGSRSCREAARDASSDRETLALAERGCEADDPASCLLAGQVRLRGEGIGRDARKAERAFRIGCALGNAESCARAHGLELARACERFSAVACRDLALAYQRGDEVDRDLSQAALHLRKACLLGADDACSQAGIR